MARFLSLGLLASTALLLLVQLERVAAKSKVVGCVDNMGACGPSVGLFHGKGSELSQWVRDYRQKYGRDFECGRGLRGKICVQIKDHFQSFVDDLRLCIKGATTAAPTTAPPTTPLPNPRDCQDLGERGESGDRVATIFPDGQTPVSVRCIENATVIINRNSFSEGFNMSFADYATGFGDRNGDYYFGNEYLHILTSSRNYKLRVDVTRPEGTAEFAEYTVFQVGPASDNYRLSVGGYSGDAGDALTGLNGEPFTTYDRADDEEYQDLAILTSGGFWFSVEFRLYLSTVTSSPPSPYSLTWGSTNFENIETAKLSLIRI